MADVDTLGPHQASGPSPGHGRLPADLTSFVGRRHELTAVRGALTECRLVTLTGIGGVGKTRLALRVATSVRRNFPDGVWLIELADVHDPDFVVDVVATTLGVRDYTGRPPRDSLVEAMAEGARLLVLDNCEQVVDAVADLVQTLLERCAGLHVLTTSRELLGLGCETVIPVSPLTTPSRDRSQPVIKVSRFDAVALFAERAASAVPGFALTDDNTATIAKICARLDGLPLAIELAAARTRALSPEQILQRLIERRGLLTWSSRGVPPRQQTLKWSIGWSYDLCTPEEQQLWRRLSLFTGSFDIDDVEHICGEDCGGDLLDILASLVDKSIIVREDARGRARYRMLDTVRGYGREQLDETAGDVNLRLRFRDWYTRMALDAEADWISPRQLDWSDRLRGELPNLREAFDFAIAENDGSALPLAAALYPFWIARGLFAEGRRWLHRALDQTHRQPTTLQAKSLFAAAILAAFQGDLTVAAARAEDALALESPAADPIARAYVAMAAGITAFCSGDLEQARVRLRFAADTPGVDAYPQLQLEALSLLGWAHVGDHTSQALTFQGRALAIAQGHGEYIHRGYSLWANGVDTWRSGDREHATELLEAGLRLTRQTRDPLMVFTCLQALAWLDAENGQVRRAAVVMGAADAHRRLVGSNPVFFPNLLVHQNTYEETVREALDAKTLDAAHREGASMTTADAIAYTLGEQSREPMPDTPGQERTVLTKREHEVAELVAEGLTNKEIAQRLTISRRTVDGHVDHILTKLGFTSRVQVATWITESAPTD
ncbi:protein kinase [Rhodococcus hoagii]|nr:protein kinase [Prescottella equi]MBM4666600.1 protein kinase [Prescottella equi]NKV86124.1 protein kinase [Prescottella equi]